MLNHLENVWIFAEGDPVVQHLLAKLPPGMRPAGLAPLNLKTMHQTLHALQSGCVVLVATPESALLKLTLESLQHCDRLSVVVFCEGISAAAAVQMTQVGAQHVEAEAYTPDRLLRACALAHARLAHEQEAKASIQRLSQQLHEIEVLERAKRSLITLQRFTEERAHKFLLKLAMEQQITVTEAAEQILQHQAVRQIG